MATRSRIGIIREDGTVESVYCHWDGYPSYNGKILEEHYKSKELVEELIGLCDLNSLAPTPDDTIAYNRWRGKNTKSRIDADVSSFEHNGFEEYGYLFNPETKTWRIIREGL